MENGGFTISEGRGRKIGIVITFVVLGRFIQMQKENICSPFP